MAITYLKRIDGSTNNFVFLWSSDSTATCTASGYLTAQKSNIIALNFSDSLTPFQWFTNDIVLLSANDGLSFCSIDSSFTTLSLIASGVVPLPVTVANAVTAHSGGGQPSATQLSASINNVSTVAAAGDSVKLPASSPGLQICVINSGANACQVYGLGSDTINGIAAGTGVSQASLSVCFYECTAAGAWHVNVNSLSINLIAGQAGSAGFLQSFPATASKGSLKLVAVENTGDTVTTISNAAMGQASVISIPDPGAATANFNISANPLVVGNLVNAKSTDGALQDQGVAMKSVAQAVVAGGAAAQTVTDAFCTTGSCVIAVWNDTTNAVEIEKVAAGNGSFVVTSTADPGASHLNYVIFK